MTRQLLLDLRLTGKALLALGSEVGTESKEGSNSYACGVSLNSLQLASVHAEGYLPVQLQRTPHKSALRGSRGLRYVDFMDGW